MKELVRSNMGIKLVKIWDESAKDGSQINLRYVIYAPDGKLLKQTTDSNAANSYFFELVDKLEQSHNEEPEPDNTSTLDNSMGM